jgi:hypothetical protein
MSKAKDFLKSKGILNEGKSGFFNTPKGIIYFDGPDSSGRRELNLVGEKRRDFVKDNSDIKSKNGTYSYEPITVNKNGLDGILFAKNYGYVRFITKGIIDDKSNSNQRENSWINSSTISKINKDQEFIDFMKEIKRRFDSEK